MDENSQDTETRDLEVYELYHNTRRILLVDTPGFNNSGKGDAEILEMLAAWFSTCYYLKKALAGVIYLYPITDDMRASTLKNLDLLQKLCGSDAMKTVTFITTMWDKNFSQKEQAYLNREKFLIEKSWLTMTHHGAVVLRSHNKKTDMPGLLDSILRQSSPVTLAVQIQLVDRKLKLADTDPGKVLIHDIRTPPTVLESWKRERSRLLAKGQDLGDQDLSYLDFLNFYIAAVEPGNEEHAAKRLETWTFESVLNDIFDTAILGGAGAGFYGADHDIYLGALAVRLTPGIAVAVASAGGLGAMGALVNRSGVWKHSCSFHVFP